MREPEVSFDDFLAELRRPEPYSWQRRFAERCAAGEPPAVIAVPTGAGKTTAVDALVWALSCQADRPAGQRTVGVRIVWAIDRRILVDEVHARASALAKQLETAQAGPLRLVADRLRKLAGEGSPPLVATRWRGGIATERSLAGPLQPQVITSTVGQIASRLLFRGFGVSDASQALAAGLAACDTTICLDEAHLAQPFRQTVAAIRDRRMAETGAQFGVPGLRAITITATPHQDEDEAQTIRLDDDDRARPDLQQRLTGTKLARLVEPEGQTDREAVDALCRATLACVDEGVDSVACVVNSVRRAREVRRRLEPALAKQADDVALGLLVGPQRPADRADFLRQHGPKLFGRVQDGPRLVVVATQTFEVGLDADVEAMVTESASSTALIQRLGRLNRRGDRHGQATIVRDAGSWLYADDEEATWAWLQARERGHSVDVSVDALAAGPEPPRPRSIPRAPELTDAIVDALTCPEGSLGAWQDIAVEAFWRPDEQRRADVALCWRADLRWELTGRDADAHRAMLLELVPPQRDELLTLTINGARSLIAATQAEGGAAGAAGRLALAEGDVEGATTAARVPAVPDTADGVPFLVVRGDDVLRGTLGASDDTTVRPVQIRPGDVVVLPARSGPPYSGEAYPATDVAADVHGVPADAPAGTGSAVEHPVPVRITPEALRVSLAGGPLTQRAWEAIASECARAHAALSSRDGDGAAGVAPLVGWLRTRLPEHPGLARLEHTLADPGWRIALHELEPDRDGIPRFDPGDDAIDEEPEEEDGERAEEDASDVDAVESAGRPTALGRLLHPVWVLVPERVRDRERVSREKPPTIGEHGGAVLAEIRRCTAHLELPEPARAALLAAAAAHDHGKADPRMQAYFRRGVHDFGAEPIAKSTFGTRAPAIHRLAQRLSGLPSRWRHEIASVAVLDDALASGAIAIDGISMDLIDRPLALDAAGGHHGRGFPLPPVPGDGAPSRPFYVDAAGVAGTARGDGNDGWGDGEWLLRALDVRTRYGAWGAAYLEGLVRLADRAVSRRGE